MAVLQGEDRDRDARRAARDDHAGLEQQGVVGQQAQQQESRERRQHQAEQGDGVDPPVPQAARMSSLPMVMPMTIMDRGMVAPRTRT